MIWLVAPRGLGLLAHGVGRGALLLEQALLAVEALEDLDKSTGSEIR